MIGGREVLSLDSIRVIDLGTRTGLLTVLGVGEGSLCTRWRPVACAKALMCEGERWAAAPVFVATAITCMVGCTLAVASELALSQWPGALNPSHSLPASSVVNSLTFGSERCRRCGASGFLQGMNIMMHVVSSGRAVILPIAWRMALSFSSGDSPTCAWQAPVHGLE